MKLAVIWHNFSAHRKMFRKILNPILARYLRRNIKFCQMATHENWFNFWSCYNAHTHYLTLQLNRLWIEISATMTKPQPKKKKSNLDSKSRKAKQKKMSRQRQFMDESLSQAGKFQLSYWKSYWIHHKESGLIKWNSINSSAIARESAVFFF